MTTAPGATAPETTTGTPSGPSSGTASVTVRYFAAAAEAAGTPSEALPAATLGELRTVMLDRHGNDLERVLGRCSLLQDGERLTEDGAVLRDGAVVDVLPPFAGG